MTGLLEDKDRMISDALDVCLAGFERVCGTTVGARQPAVKAVG